MEPLLEQAHRLLAAAIQSGDVVVDATIGNGHDTLHLARCVGPEGLVIGFDVQDAALLATRERLEAGGFVGQVVLLRAGHETMATAVPETLTEQERDPDDRLSAVCFNLGYLPGSDRSIITQPKTTVAALRTSVDLLKPGGIITAVLYPGHPGGAEERNDVLAWACGLPDGRFGVIHRRSPGRSTGAELLVVRPIPSAEPPSRRRASPPCPA